MEIRKYKQEDCKILAQLFFETVHTVNAKDYSEPQLWAWADGNVDLDAWNKSFLQNNTIVAVKDNSIVGFGDMGGSGYLDRLYVHKDYQNQGIATAIVDNLEKDSVLEFTTHASITAKGFFEKRGYSVIRENKVIRKGEKLLNYIMKK